ncbi:MAG: SAM hydrolase/SAM-dependent halogenase family protein [Candidatus Thorarchaeota archaeon]
MIVLLTDFGDSEYVGVMRGVILSLSPTSQIVDLTHSVPPQSVREGAWILLQNYKYFPHSSIFVAVIDPGVGTDRDAVMVRTSNYVFIGPDNGLIYPTCQDDGIVSISRLVVGPSASHTFHGRDVFARAGALLDAGREEEIEQATKDGLSSVLEFHREGRTGEVVRIDRFGNIVTNLVPMSGGFLSKTKYVLRTRGTSMDLTLFNTYAEGPKDGLFLVVGSYGTLEIASQNRPASSLLNLKVGDRLDLE